MKQKKLLRQLYQANLKNDTARLKKLHLRELAHILEKRRQGKYSFSPKWCVTDDH